MGFLSGAFKGIGGILGLGMEGPAGQREQLALLRKARENSRMATLQAQATQREALPLLQKSFDASRNTLVGAAERDKRLAARNAAPMIGQAGFQLDSIGQGASSLAPLVQRDMRARLAAANQEIDARLAQSLAPLAAQQAQAQAGVLGGVAGLGLQGIRNENDIVSQLSQAYARPKRRKKGLLDIVGAAAPIVGALSNPASTITMAGAGGYGATGEGDDEGY